MKLISSFIVIFLAFSSLENSQITEIQQAEKIEKYLDEPIPGLEQTYRDVLNVIVKEGHNVWVLGGAIRDLLSPEEVHPKDLDFTFDCSIQEIVKIFSRNNIPYTKIEGYDVISVGTDQGGEMEGNENTFSIKAKDEDLEFTVNTIHYHFNTGTFEPRFVIGLDDLETKTLKVMATNLNEWLYSKQSDRPIKIFRYWKMRGKGYSGLNHLERFIVVETAKAYRKNPELFKQHVLQYLGGHFSSFEEVSQGCSLTMGPKWCRENVDALYEEAEILNQKIDAIWNQERANAL